MTIVCKNCKNHYKGRFCNHCGQSADTHDINFHYLWHEIQHGILHFDSGILYTVKQLFTRPGHAIREFIDGKRVGFVKPFAFVFILCTIYGLLAHYLKFEIFHITTTDEDYSSVEAIKLINKAKSIYGWFNEHYACTALLSLPIISLASYLAFRKKRVNYLKHIVLNAYIIGQQTLLYILLLLVSVIMKIEFTGTIRDVIAISLSVWAYNQFFNSNPAFKNIVLTILAYIYFKVMSIVLPLLFIIYVYPNMIEFFNRH